MNIILGNSSYPNHMTDEGDQLQRSLADAGWVLCGDGERNVIKLLDRHQPEIVFVQDVRDWHKSQGGSFGRKDLHYDNCEALKDHPSFKVTPVKDAGSCIEFQRDFAASIGLNAAVVYYHPKSVLNHSTWLKNTPLIRHYHTVDSVLTSQLCLNKDRKRAIVTGALNERVYPLRGRIFRLAQQIGVTTKKHPGYSNTGSDTPAYLKEISGYKVHVKTASDYGFALRGIVESVACGCTCVTNLPDYDVLPEIDGALIRIPSDATDKDIRRAVDRAEAEWSHEKAMVYAAKANDYYDYRKAGLRLSENIIRAKESR